MGPMHIDLIDIDAHFYLLLLFIVALELWLMDIHLVTGGGRVNLSTFRLSARLPFSTKLPNHPPTD